jgi:hypothetical protein
MPVPDFSPGEKLTADAMDSIGLWRIASSTFTSQAVIHFQNVFTSKYSNYKVIISNFSRSAIGNLSFRLSAGGTVSSTAYYMGAAGFYSSGVSASDNLSNSVIMNCLYCNTTPQGASWFDVYNPAVAAQTAFTGQYTFNVGTDSGIRNWGGSHQVATAYDGIYFSEGTFTGTITIYGYRKP